MPTSRRPASAGRRSGIVALVAILAVLFPSCGGGSTTSSIPGEAVTIAAHPDGGFLWATLDGEVRDDQGERVATVDAETDGQRGLLGLAIDDEGRVFASYTDTTFDLVVVELADGEERLVWRGPTTVQGGNGGRMIIDGDELILGIGLLDDRTGQADPGSIVGKIIAIDSDAAPDEQRPRILSGPWNNPFAFDTTSGGELWVADNHPRDGDERLARGDLGMDPEVALVLPPDSAPSGLAAADDALYVCSYNDLTLIRYELVDGRPGTTDQIADDCVLDVTLLADGDLAYSTGSSIVRLTP